MWWEDLFQFPLSCHCTYGQFWASHHWVRDAHGTLSKLSEVYALILDNKYRHVKWGLGVALNPSLNIVYTRPQVEMSSNLLVGVKGILIIRHTKLRGMSCTCEPMENMYILQSPPALSSRGFLDPSRWACSSVHKKVNYKTCENHYMQDWRELLFWLPDDQLR